MKQLIEALIYAVDYIDGRTDEMDEQHDVGALESVASYLAELSEEEFKELERTAKELDRMDWMEDMFPDRYDS